MTNGDADEENQPLLPPPPVAGPDPTIILSSDADAANRRWLGLLFFETLALLVLQLVLGDVSGSLSLIADAPHSAVDVVTYGLAYWVEDAKLRLASGDAPKGTSSSRCWRDADPRRLDAAAAGFGLVALLGATTFVAREAFNRLGRANGAESDQDSEAMGSALLIFSVASTAGNVGVLLMFRRWQRQSLPAPPPPPPPPAWGERRRDEELKSLAGAGEEDASEQFAVPSRRHRQRQKRLGHTNFNVLPGSCQDVCCSEPGKASDGALAAWPTLHELLHPGCAHKGFSSKDGGKAADHNYSLNTSSAMLHLMSDVLRGFMIFVVALLMKCHAVSDASHADALCALFVAALVLLGSGAMMNEVAEGLFGTGAQKDSDNI